MISSPINIPFNKEFDPYLPKKIGSALAPLAAVGITALCTKKMLDLVNEPILKPAGHLLIRTIIVLKHSATIFSALIGGATIGAFVTGAALIQIKKIYQMPISWQKEYAFHVLSFGAGAGLTYFAIQTLLAAASPQLAKIGLVGGCLGSVVVIAGNIYNRIQGLQAPQETIYD